MNVPSIGRASREIGRVVAEHNAVGWLEAKRCGVVLARADLAVAHHLGHLIDDFDRAVLRRSGQIEDDAPRVEDLLRE